MESLRSQHRSSSQLRRINVSIRVGAEHLRSRDVSSLNNSPVAVPQEVYQSTKSHVEVTALVFIMPSGGLNLYIVPVDIWFNYGNWSTLAGRG